MSEKIEITRDGYLKLLNKIYENKIEERELALDRYRIADEQMDNGEQFVFMGGHAVNFLKVAAESTNALALLAKEIKSIIYKDDAPTEMNVTLGEDIKSKIRKFASEKNNKVDPEEKLNNDEE